MDYATTNPNIIVRHCASDMMLHVDHDASCLVLSKVRSRIDECFQLSNHPNDNHTPFLNGTIVVVCTFFQHIVSSKG